MAVKLLTQNGDKALTSFQLFIQPSAFIPGANGIIQISST